jgi:hypothetical protein
MNRIAAFVGALALMLLVLVPVAAAAEPWDGNEHVIFTTGGDVALTDAEHADLLVVVDGTATIEGDARSVIVINGTANFVGSNAKEVIAISSHVTLDATSVVSGDIRTISSTVDATSGSVVAGSVRDLGPDLVGALVVLGSALFFVYVAFVLSTIVAGVLLAGLAARQVREAGALISREPLMSIAAAFLGILAITVMGALAIVTVFGAPFGLGLLLFVLPGLLFVGYLVAGIWVGEQIVGRTASGVARERPYLAALVGLSVVGAVGLVPGVSGIISFVGFGAVVLLMWRILRATTRPSAAAGTVGAPSAA